MEKLTQQEEDAMLAIWKIGPNFIRDFIEIMPDPKPPYTTLASTIKNLERKGYVKSERFANAFRYDAAIKEADYKHKFMNGFIENYFQSSYKDLVTFFAKEKKLSPEDLKEIINAIENPEQ